MCDKCQKLLELYAETQLECLKHNKSITRAIITTCGHCKEKVAICAECAERSLIIN